MERAVLVTGAGSGIGLASALHLARLGFRAVAAARTPEGADAVAKAAAEAGLDVEPVVLDVTDAEGCRRVVAGLEPYGVVNNAGYMNLGPIEDVDPDDALRQLHTMVVAPMRLARLALPGMRGRGEGRIVNVSSVAAHASYPMLGWYEAVKHALSTASEALRQEVAGWGVDVVTIEPGSFRTDIWEKARQDLLRRRDGSAYGPAYERTLAMLERLRARVPGPEPVAERIGLALTAGTPKPRYRVGADAPLLEAGWRFVPRRAQARLARTVLDL